MLLPPTDADWQNRLERTGSAWDVSNVFTEKRPFCWSDSNFFCENCNLVGGTPTFFVKITILVGVALEDKGNIW